jgi:hypothetical protein
VQLSFQHLEWANPTTACHYPKVIALLGEFLTAVVRAGSALRVD